MVKQLAAEAKQAGRPAPSLEVSLLDLASLESVRGFVQRWEQQQRPLHILINNAGMFNMGGELGLSSSSSRRYSSNCMEGQTCQAEQEMCQCVSCQQAACVAALVHAASSELAC